MFTFHKLFTLSLSFVVFMQNWRPVIVKLAVVLMLAIVIFTG